MKPQLKELPKEEILFRLKEHDLWRLEDAILFVHGYEHEGVDWDYLKKTNEFPMRQYDAALEATNSINPKQHLLFVDKVPQEVGFAKCYVKKGPFFKWAVKRWPHSPQVVKTYSIYQQYKTQNKNVAPSHQTNAARIKNHGDKLQVCQFIEHCKTQTPETYWANLTQIANQTRIELKDVPGLPSTFRKRTKRMAIEELKKQAALDSIQ